MHRWRWDPKRCPILLVNVTVTYTLSYVTVYLLLWNDAVFQLWEILLESFFAWRFGKRGHAHSIHKHKACDILNSLEESWGFFRQPLDASPGFSCSPRLVWVWKQKRHPELLTECRITGLEGTWRGNLIWPPSASKGDSMQILPTGAGACSQPLRPLSPGERSIVSAQLNSTRS